MGTRVAVVMGSASRSGMRLAGGGSSYTLLDGLCGTTDDLNPWLTELVVWLGVFSIVCLFHGPIVLFVFLFLSEFVNKLSSNQ